jgi:hypothetical protein
VANQHLIASVAEYRKAVDNAQSTRAAFNIISLPLTKLQRHEDHAASSPRFIPELPQAWNVVLSTSKG